MIAESMPTSEVRLDEGDRLRLWEATAPLEADGRSLSPGDRFVCTRRKLPPASEGRVVCVFAIDPSWTWMGDRWKPDWGAEETRRRFDRAMRA